MTTTYRTPEIRSKTPENLAELAGKWVKAITNDQDLNVFVAENFDLVKLQEQSVAEGRPVAEVAAAEHRDDPGVKRKNDFLKALEMQLDLIGDFLGRMERQAADGEHPQEMRRQQFAGLLDVLSIATQDDETVSWLKDRLNY